MMDGPYRSIRRNPRPPSPARRGRPAARSGADPAPRPRPRKGGFVLARHTRRDRKMAKLLEIKEELRRRWHQDKAEQGEWLGSVVRGFFAYHAVPTNTRALSTFRYHVLDLWRRALRRRSQRDRATWKSMARLADRWLPMPRISHPWPSQRFRVKHPRWEPYAGKPHVRFCAGGAQ